jgi:hypothetical protein
MRLINFISASLNIELGARLFSSQLLGWASLNCFSFPVTKTHPGVFNSGPSIRLLPHFGLGGRVYMGCPIQPRIGLVLIHSLLHLLHQLRRRRGHVS